ncbi:exodeoxyribonuclease I [Candidatus Saccharibacteria bacterium]|nr:exodeoxyribonuclease I [Candidatus Saccharibacteria bacterium]
MEKSFLFYDLETSGLSTRDDRIMQFAAQRTDMNLKEIGEPINILIKMTNDTLPSPSAVRTTGITPQATQADGLTEAEFCRYVINEIFTPNTIIVGYNNVRYDDEMMRHLFWRNFYDPYEWQWKDGRSRWDMLDVVRMARALRPEKIKWPVDDDGNPTNRLELITKENDIKHEHAHDALSDVFATLAVARLIKEKQPQLFNYLFKIRGKKEVQKIVNLDNKQPFVYASGKYGKDRNFITVAFPLTSGRNGNIVVYDLSQNIEQFLLQKPKDSKTLPVPTPTIKELAFNRCPAVAPISVLEKNDGWKKIGLDKKEVEKNLKQLLDHPEIAEQIRIAVEEREYKPEEPKDKNEATYFELNVENRLYDSFLPDQDRVRCEAIRNANSNQLADFHPNFIDERLPELLLHYKAKNFFDSLTESEQLKWEKYRRARLIHQSKYFLEDLEKQTNEGMDDFLIEELKLWYESVQDVDY